jgi:hypothetical protein
MNTRGSARRLGADRRFLATAIALPVAILLASGLALELAIRLSGHPVTADGATSISATSSAIMLFGSLATMATVLLAVVRRLPLERLRYAPIPVSCAAGVFVATVFVGLLPIDASAWFEVGAAVAGVVAGAYFGHRAAVSLLKADALPLTSDPAPPTAERYPLGQSATAVWTGRVPAPPPIEAWIFPAVYVIYVLLSIAVAGMPWVWAMIGIAVVGPATYLGRANRRVRIAIGPAGIQIRSGLRDRVRLAISLAQIEGAAATTVERRMGLTGDWRSTSHGLTIATRSGPALDISLTDGTNVVISIPDPAQPASVINSLLDQRAAKSTRNPTEG